MRFTTQDPDIETIVRRIDEHDYDLQPDFQRGDVWTDSKQKRLIDSILRGWHIPPVHLVAREGGLSDVLDGQQRLTAIRDFLRGDFAVDGKIEPASEFIASLHGLRFGELPDEVKKKIKRFTIRVFELEDYSPDEPHELFFRLNQPTNLTEAEKRNAFIGPPRNEVKRLVGSATEMGMNAERIGFSNARMAYDDVLARVLITLEARTLDAKITSSRVTERYRSEHGFPPPVIRSATEGLKFLLSLSELDAQPRIVRPNKATVHTWLCLAAQLSAMNALEQNADLISRVITQIEEQRWNRARTEQSVASGLLLAFQDRSTARVADVSSVLVRDLIAWMFVVEQNEAGLEGTEKYQKASRAFLNLDIEGDMDEQLYQFAVTNAWGKSNWS